MRFLIKILTFIFAIGFASCITDGESYSEPWSIANGSKVPEFCVTTVDGKDFDSWDLSGKRAVIVFFNTECNDCRRELPKLQKAYEATCNDYEWIAIGRDQDGPKAASFWKENDLTIPYSAISDRSIYSLFASAGIPRVYIVDNLTIVAQFAPETPIDAETLIKTLNTLI